MLQVAGQHLFVPLEHDRGFGPVNAEGLVGDALGAVGRPAKEAHRGVLQRAQFEAMHARRGPMRKVSRAQLAVSRDFRDLLAVIVKGQISAARLLQVKDLEQAAFGGDVDVFARGLGGYAYTAQSKEAVAAGARQTPGVPAVGCAAGDIEAAITAKWMARQRE